MSEPPDRPTFSVEFVKGEERWHVEVEPETNLLEASRVCGAPVQTLCHGIAACVQCKVRIIEGKEALSPPENLEKDRIGNTYHITGERLGCQARVRGDVIVEVLEARLPRRARGSRRR
ncbi:MAG: 2Fe-2S ferredoxin [Bradymonadia bacterium]